MTGSASFAVFRLACMLAMLAVLPATAAKAKITKFADSPMSFQELKTMGTLPLPQPFLTPKGDIFLEDTPVAVTLALLLIMGIPFMYADVCEFAEDEDAQDRGTTVSDRSSASGKRASKRHFTICVVVAVLAVLASLPVRELAIVPDAAAQDEIHTIKAAALQLLKPSQSRMGVPSLRAHVASDRAVAAFLAGLTIIGWIIGSFDLQEMEAEEKRKNAGKKVEEDKRRHFRDACENLPALPMALQLAFNATAAGNLCMCAMLVQRQWAQAAVFSLQIAADDVTLLFVGLFALFGLTAMCADFWTFAKEQQEKNNAQKVSASSSHSTKKAEKQMSCSQYLTMHWRSVSCAVLLLSVFVAAAASLSESAM